MRMFSVHDLFGCELEDFLKKAGEKASIPEVLPFVCDPKFKAPVALSCSL